MKKTLITLSAVAVLFAACNQQEKTHNSQNHEDMKHGETKTENVMMEAMDKSMMAMHKAKITGNADYDFASMMIPHHEGAVEMAREVVKNGKSQELITFGNGVIADQEREISILKDFLKTANQQASKEVGKFKKALNSSMAPMMEGMAKAKLTNNIDQDFVALMIPHHQSAVDMAKAYLPYANNEKIKLLAQQIIQAQEEEIKWLKTK